MNIQVNQVSNAFKVKLKTTDKYSVRTLSGGIQVPANFSDLNDFNSTGVQNGYVVMYDAATQKYITVDPDTVLSNAVSGGLPNNFINQLDVDLDDKIDLDAGTF